MSDELATPTHDWEHALRGATPVLVCARCHRVWYPDRRQPAAACKPTRRKVARR